MSAPNELSFLPDDYLERKAQRRTNVICATLFLVVMVAMGTAFALTEKSVKEVENQHKAVDAQYAEAAKRLEQVKQMQAKQRTMSQKAELTASLLEKVPRGNILAEVTRRLPAGVSLLDLVLESKVKAEPVKPVTAFEQKKAAAAPAPPKPKVYQVTIKITGVAYSDVQVSDFIQALGRHEFFQDVNLIVSEQFTYNNDEVRRFQLEMTLNPDAVVKHETPTNKQVKELD